MSRDNPWAQHYQSFWQAQAGNPVLPLWLRTVALAYGSHHRNGHTPLHAGDLRLTLATVDNGTGEIRLPHRPRVSEAVRLAIEYGFLDGRSSGRCLVVPRHAVQGGMNGKETARCDRH
jgi:hypothetical protein